MSSIGKEHSTPDLLKHFASMDDPRQEAKVIYPLGAVFLLVLCIEAFQRCFAGWVHPPIQSKRCRAAQCSLCQLVRCAYESCGLYRDMTAARRSNA
jgi:hypothetical protein